MYEIRIKSHHIIAMWWSVKECVKLSSSPSDLVECMDYLSTKQKQTNKDYKLKIDQDRSLIVFTCLKYVLDNQLVKNEKQLQSFFVAMERISQFLDLENKAF